jgi:hypothetical protein
MSCSQYLPAQPGLHMHTKSVVFWMRHVPPFKQVVNEHGLMTMSQRLPVNPALQKQP